MDPLVKVVAFDVDDTLYPEEQFVRGGMAAAGEALDGIVGRRLDAARVFLEVLAAEGPFQVFDSGLRRLGVDGGPDVVRAMVRAYREHLPCLAPHAGVVELLDGLLGAGVVLAAITDGPPPVQRSKWAALGLGDRFSHVIFAQDVDGASHPKPSPVPFRRLEALTGCQGPAVVYVGDNPARDFPPADACGWRTVRVKHPGAFHAHDPDPKERDRPVAVTAGELASILSAWTRPSM